MESPCFNRETKTDCPRCKAGCAVGCPEWDAYTKERDKVYEQRRIENDAKQTLHEGKSAYIVKKQRQHMRNGWKRKIFKDG